MKSIIICASLILGLAFQSCSKDDSESLTKSELLCLDSWRIEAATTTSLGGNEDILDAFYIPCAKDDLITYAMTGTVLRDDNVDLCDGLPQEANGTWELTDGDEKLTVQLDGGLAEFTVESLTRHMLELRFVTGYNGVAIVLTLRFVHED